jgi:hypothetical protein
MTAMRTGQRGMRDHAQPAEGLDELRAVGVGTSVTCRPAVGRPRARSETTAATCAAFR